MTCAPTAARVPCRAAAPAAARDHVLAAHEAVSAGRDQDALVHLHRAMALEPRFAEARDAVQTLLTRSRDTVPDAAGERATASPAMRAEIHLIMGSALEASADLPEALISIRRATELDPSSGLAFLRLAALLRQAGQPSAAADCAARATGIMPDHYGARVVRALVLDDLGRHDEATEDFIVAARLAPRTAAAMNALGTILLGQRRNEAAAEVLRMAARSDPGQAEPQGNLGLALQRLGRVREAFGCYAAAVTLDPHHAVAQCNLAGLLIDMGHLDAAISACRLAGRADPHRLEPHLYTAIALRRLGRTAEALASLRQALALQPRSAEALVELCDLRQQTCDWAGLDEQGQVALAETVRAGRRVPPFQILTLSGSAAEQHTAARLWAGAFARKTTPLTAYGPRPGRREGERMRIGYLSADFRTHATAMLIAELFERHDRQRFTLFGYSCGEDDASPMRRRLVSALDRFVDVRDLSHPEAARTIHADGIDVLIDLKGFTREARPEILAHRPAAIQVNFLGYPGTMGAPFVDYIVADRVVAPIEHAAFFDEKIVHLPHCYQPNDARRGAGPRPTRAACGLPEQGFVFCCLNASYKITPEIFSIWMRLLLGRPGAVLWLYEGDGSAVENLRREAASRGVDPARLVFAPKVLPEAHLGRLPLADLFLDTLPVNAHTTASEALWAGVPLVTCTGEAFAARVAASLLGAVGLPELVTTSLDDYEALAAALAGHPARLAQIRRRLAEGRATAPLFDTPLYTRHFEAALTRMVDLRDLGRPPEAFAIGEA